MGLLDKAGANAPEAPKKATEAPAPAAAKPEPAQPKPAPAPTKPAAKAKKQKAPKARPVGLAEDYELASTMNRRISWLVNFIINFGVLFAAIFISMSDTGVVTTILFGTSAAIIVLNAVFIPMKFSRNLGQFVSRTKFIRGDGTNPLFLHGILVNTVGLLSLIGVIMIFTQFQNLTEADNTAAIIFFSLGTIFVILWFIDRFLRNGSEMGQGMYDLVFAAYLVKYVPSDDEKATGIWARLENMGNFGDQLMKRQEERAAKRTEAKSAKVESADTTSQEG